MFIQLSLFSLVATFGVAAAFVWWAGIKLTNTTDILAHRFGFGHAISGMILLAIATNLPEIAIVASAAWHGDLGVAIGNILGGIGIYPDSLRIRRAPLPSGAGRILSVP